MIKFVASDLDGTLLNEEKKLPEGTFALIEKLYDKGILFAPASGRQYDNLKRLFAPVADKVIFIAENGALVKYREETLFLQPLEEADILSSLQLIGEQDWACPVLCCERTAYVEKTDEPFFSLTKAAYTSLKKVKNIFDAVGKEPACKISVYDKTNRADEHAKELASRLPRLRTVVSGKEWLDISSPLVHKGIAVDQIRKVLSLKKDECMAFGDHMNDYEMLLACGHPFVTENGYPPLKQLIGNTIPSNVERGVLLQLQKLLNE